MGIPKQNASKIRPKHRAPSYADQKSKIMAHDIYVSQLHLVNQTQYFIDWIELIKIVQGSAFLEKKYIDGNGNWFCNHATFISKYTKDNDNVWPRDRAAISQDVAAQQPKPN